MIYSHDQNVVVYREFTAEGFWHESQDYEFTHSCSRRRQKGNAFSLLGGVQEKVIRAKKWTSVSVPLMGFLLLFWLTALCLQGRNESRLRFGEWKIKQQRSQGSCQKQMSMWQNIEKIRCRETLLANIKRE